jgi:phosphoglucomutase
VFGGEESYGYLLGTHARDKDAVVLCCGIAEMLVWSRAKGMSLEQLLQEIHQKFGVFAEDQLALKLEGLEGQAIIAEVMASLRSDPPRAMQGEELSLVRDVQSGKVLNGSLSETGTLDFPNENVLELSYGNALKFTARPSGTEPKVKFYLVARDTDNLPISSDDIIARTTGTREKLSEIKSELHEEILRRIDAAKGKS